MFRGEKMEEERDSEDQYFITVVREWGHSLGVRIPSEYVKLNDLEKGQMVGIKFKIVKDTEK